MRPNKKLPGWPAFLVVAFAQPSAWSCQGDFVKIKWPGADEKSLSFLRAISVLLNHNQTLLNFLFDCEKPRLRKRAGILRDDAWRFSEDEQLLIRVALDLWSGSGHVQLWELTEAWEKADWTLFSAAISELHSKNTPGAIDDGNQTQF